MITLSDMECMKELALINRGNQYRIKQVFKRADAEKQITIGFIGGSITMGCNAAPMESNCYAALCTSWLRNIFSEEQVCYINAGIGATDSYLGVHRVESDLLSHRPDIVVVEFAVNDGRSINKESYDSLVRKIYECESKPAVLLLLLTQRDGNDNSNIQKLIGRYYDLPIISYKDAIVPYLNSRRLLWSLIGEKEDGTHPTNIGHFFIASFLIAYLEDAYEHRGEEEEEQRLKSPYTMDSYHDAMIYDHTNLLPTEAVEFEPVLLQEAQFKYGWRTRSGGTIAFYLTGRNIGMIYYGTKDEQSGIFEVWIDGQKQQNVNADFMGKWGSYADYIEIIHTEKKALHKVEIRKAECSVGLQFTILGFTVS